MNKKKQPSLKKIPFVIQELDPMGQGVAKDNGKITFIAKTLPGETGVARLYKTRKGVSFAQMEKLEVISNERIEPECPHYKNCPGCHYLHTDYEHEIAYKKQALEKLLRKLEIDSDKLRVVAAPQRLAYRNRMQLHYRHKYIGLIDSLNDEVMEIPECKLIREELMPAMAQLYADKSWSHENKGGGHCEIYLKDGEVNIEWNKPYAHGGFTQVNDAMNHVLCAAVNSYLAQNDVSTVLDLFAGDGNLTNKFAESKTVVRKMVDTYADTFVDNGHEDFIQIDLFDESALAAFQRICKQKEFDVIVLDPPRKGFPDLNRWVKKFKPKKLIYISCNTATMARDLENIEGKYTVDQVELMDLFPSTYHFETIAYLSF